MTAGSRELVLVCAPRDRKLGERLDIHLASLKNEGIVTVWDERQVAPGMNTRQEMRRHLESAGVILLLVSADFLAAQGYYEELLPLALQRANNGQALVLPVLLAPVAWEKTPLARIRCLPENGKPIINWTNREAALASVAAGIRLALYAHTPITHGTHDTKQQAHARAARAFPMEGTPMTGTPGELTTSILHKAIGRYYSELNDYRSKGMTELNLRPAFQNLLSDMARRVNLTLMHEMTIHGRIRPDGVLVSEYHIRRGCWKAKGPRGNLEAEIEQKKRDGYPLDNTIFENTLTAVLFQDGQRFDFDLRDRDEVTALLQKFLKHQTPENATFERAVLDFKDQIPTIAKRLLALINEEQQRNGKFISAFNAFHELCKNTLNPKISVDEIKEMLIQHLLTERLFRKVFDNPDFVSKNAIAVEIEKVIQALTSRSFNRSEFLRSLDPFYGAIEAEARSAGGWSERQAFLNTVYERFFQGFAVQKADTLGVVYTPQEIVDFMVASVDEVLKREFGKTLGLATPGVKVLDPCVGTGNFIVNIIKHIASQSRTALKEKYARDLFCNEIALLPYYIASMNIEHEYYTQMGDYAEFEGICFVDSLELAESQQLPLFVEKNTERIEREKEADIMVVVGNPPYNVGQKNENDNNKNRKYPIIDERIKETYVRDSKATLKTQLYDAYVRFFRWASDRLAGQDGIVCFISNNSFFDQISFDGMRKHLLKDFTQIYHIDLHGNVRKNPKLSGTTHNVFGIQVGVGITVAVRSSQSKNRGLYYHRVPEDWRKEEKLAFLQTKKSAGDIDWLELTPDTRQTWITDKLNSDFFTFPPMGAKEFKSAQHTNAPVLFRSYCGGVKTNRDTWVYDFSQRILEDRLKKLIETYNVEVNRWRQRSDKAISIDNFVTSDETLIKWSGDLKIQVEKGREATYEPNKIRHSLYRPFTKQYLYFDDLLNNSIYLQYLYFPTPVSELENTVIWLKVGMD